MQARRAVPRDVEAICRICADGWRDTYCELNTSTEIEATIARFYTAERVGAELDEHGTAWGGWWVTERNDGQTSPRAGAD